MKFTVTIVMALCLTGCYCKLEGEPLDSDYPSNCLADIKARNPN